MLLNFLPGPLLGIISITLYSLHLIFCSLILYVLAFFKLILPFKSVSNFVEKSFQPLAKLWVGGNCLIMQLVMKTDWQIDGFEKLSMQEWYMVICNHQSWTDILVLQKIFSFRIPFLRFFIKKQIIWLPFIGVACWIGGFPFMQRYSKEFLEKNPHLRGKDLETTRKSCERFKTVPTSILSFTEGTRYTDEKSNQQKSPYKHLLRPKAGGLSFAIEAMQDHIQKLIDVSIIYAEPLKPTVWDFACGRVKKIIVKIRVMPVTEKMVGDYSGDAEFRGNFQTWINNFWHEKDQIIESSLENNT